MPFGLNNIEATSQHSIFFCLHDLATIIISYLHDLPAHSKLLLQHLHDLCILFLRFHKYNICLNPLKCVFFVCVGQILGFIVSKYDITLDPIKFQAIIELPPPRALC